MNLSFAVSAFVAGLLTFLAPCTLPLVPGYLAFISGTSAEELKDPARSAGARKKIFLNGLFFVLGFSAVFIFFGAVAGFAGMALAPYRIWLTKIGGIFVILLGLFMLNVFKIPFLSLERRVRVPAWFPRGSWLSSFLLGSAFALGWTPCVGPILGFILFLASTSTTIVQGILMLGVFSLGLGLPFLLIALLIGSASRYISRISLYLNTVSVIGGLFLIGIGYLLLTDQMGLLIGYGFRIFGIFNYSKLMDYM